MATALFRRSFAAFHYILGLGILCLSLRTVMWAVHPEAGHHGHHAVVLASVEAIGALLFLVPRTLRVGAALLLLTIGVAGVVHAFAGEWRIDLLIYGAGVWLVAAHRLDAAASAP